MYIFEVLKTIIYGIVKELRNGFLSVVPGI